MRAPARRARPVEADGRARRDGISEIFPRRLQRLVAGLVEVDRADRRPLRQPCGEIAPAGAEIGDPAGEVVRQAVGEQARGGVDRVGREHAGAGDVAALDRRRARRQRRGGRFGLRIGRPLQPEDEAVMLGGGAGHGQDRLDPPAQAGDAVGLAAGDDDRAARRHPPQRLGDPQLVLRAMAPGEHQCRRMARALGQRRHLHARLPQRQKIRPEPLHGMDRRGPVRRQAEPCPRTEEEHARRLLRRRQHAGLEGVEQRLHCVVGHGRLIEHFQQKCEAVLRPEMRLKQRDRAVLSIPGNRNRPGSNRAAFLHRARRPCHAKAGFDDFAGAPANRDAP